MKMPNKKLAAGVIALSMAFFIGGAVYATTFFRRPMGREYQTLPSANFVPNNPFTFCNSLSATQIQSISTVLFSCSDGSQAFSVKASTNASPSFNLTGTGYSSLSLSWGASGPTCPGPNSAPLTDGQIVNLAPGVGYSYCATYTGGAQFGQLTIAWGA